MLKSWRLEIRGGELDYAYKKDQFIDHKPACFEYSMGKEVCPAPLPNFFNNVKLTAV